MASKARHLESHVPVTLVWQSTNAQFDGASNVTPIAFGRGIDHAPQTFFATLDDQENIGRIDVFQAVRAALACNVPGDRPEGAPIEALRYCDTNDVINAFLIWTVDMFHAQDSVAADTITHWLDLYGVNQLNAPTSVLAVYRNLPVVEVVANKTFRADQEVAIPGSVMVFDSDAPAGSIFVRMVLYPITNPGSLGEQCQQMATRNMLGSVQVG